MQTANFVASTVGCRPPFLRQACQQAAKQMRVHTKCARHSRSSARALQTHEKYTLAHVLRTLSTLFAPALAGGNRHHPPRKDEDRKISALTAHLGKLHLQPRNASISGPHAAACDTSSAKARQQSETEIELALRVLELVLTRCFRKAFGFFHHHMVSSVPDLAEASCGSITIAFSGFSCLAPLIALLIGGKKNIVSFFC